MHFSCLYDPFTNVYMSCFNIYMYMYTHTNKDAQILSTQGVNGNFIRGASFTIYVF